MHVLLYIHWIKGVQPTACNIKDSLIIHSLNYHLQYAMYGHSLHIWTTVTYWPQWHALKLSVDNVENKKRKMTKGYKLRTGCMWGYQGSNTHRYWYGEHGCEHLGFYHTHHRLQSMSWRWGGCWPSLLPAQNCLCPLKAVMFFNEDKQRHLCFLSASSVVSELFSLKS